MPPRCILSKLVCLFQLLFFFFHYFVTSGSKQFDIVILVCDTEWRLLIFMIRNISIRNTVCVPINKMVFLSFELEPGETLLTKYSVPFEFKVFILKRWKSVWATGWSLIARFNIAQSGIFNMFMWMFNSCHEMQQFVKFPNWLWLWNFEVQWSINWCTWT